MLMMPNWGRLEEGNVASPLTLQRVAARACGTVLTVLEVKLSSGSSQKLLDAHHHAPIAMQSTHSPWHQVDNNNNNIINY